MIGNIWSFKKIYSFDGEEKCPSFTFYYLCKYARTYLENFQNILALIVLIMNHFDEYYMYYIFVRVWFFLFLLFFKVFITFMQFHDKQLLKCRLHELGYVTRDAEQGTKNAIIACCYLVGLYISWSLIIFFLHMNT